MKMENIENKPQSKVECNRSCVVFATHRWDNGILNYLSYLKNEIGGMMDFLILYDLSANPIRKEDFPEYHFYFFDSTKLQGFFHQNDKLLPNIIVALIECAKQHHYGHYLLMENDIVLHGSFNKFVRTINAEKTVDCIHIATDVEGGPQKHWPIRYIRENPFENLYFSWGHVLYISYGLLMEVRQFMEGNDTINYEFLLPTMAYNGNYVVRQFENFGYRFQVSWGPAELYESKYMDERMPDTFYHPVKDLDIVDWGAGDMP